MAGAAGRFGRCAGRPAGADRHALTGTHWLDDLPDGAVPGLPGTWRQQDGGVVHELDGVATALETEGRPLVPADGRHTLSVAVKGDGRLWAVLADATSGKTSYRFRFLYAPAPAADGSVTVDLNRTQLPPCAFADAFLCPFPPPGNTLPFALEVGERAVLTS